MFSIVTTNSANNNFGYSNFWIAIKVIFKDIAMLDYLSIYY